MAKSGWSTSLRTFSYLRHGLPCLALSLLLFLFLLPILLSSVKCSLLPSRGSLFSPPAFLPTAMQRLPPPHSHGTGHTRLPTRYAFIPRASTFSTYRCLFQMSMFLRIWDSIFFGHHLSSSPQSSFLIFNFHSFDVFNPLKLRLI